MRYRLTLIGQPRLKHLADDSEIPLRTNARILYALATAFPNHVSRKELLALTWPEDPADVAANRLRVALAKWRQDFRGGLVETSEGLSLNASEISCDIWDFRAKVLETQDVFSEKDELDLLREALTPWMTDPKTPSMDIPEGGFRTDLHYSVCRAGQLSLSNEDPTDGKEIAQLGIHLFPESGDTWSVFLRSQISAGNSERAWREFHQLTHQKLASHPVIIEVAEWEKASISATDEFGFSASQREVVLKAIESLVLSRSDLLRPVFSSPQTLGLSGAHPRAMMEILQSIVQVAEVKDYHWERCMARIIGLKAWLNDARGVQETAKVLLEHTENAIILRATWNSVAISHSILREWPEAMDAIERTMEFAKETGDPIDLLTTQGNRASFLWQMGEFAASDAAYAKMFDELRTIDSPRAEFEFMMGLGNHVFVPIMQGDWPRALSMLQQCHEQRTKGKQRIPMGLLLPALALARIKLKHRDGVLAQIRNGLRENFATESDRSKQVTFELCAGVLAVAKQGALAFSVLEYTKAWRSKTNLPRCVAEDDFCQRIVDEIPTSQRRLIIAASRDPKSVGTEILQRLRVSLE